MGDYIGTAAEISLVLPANVSIGTNTAPLTLGEVASMIVEVEAELNGAAAAAGYAVPISTAASYAYALMQRHTKNGVAAQALSVIFPNMGGPGAKSTSASEYRKAYEDFVKTLRQGKIALVGAGADSSGGARELPRSFEVSENVSPSPVLPIGYRF